MTVLHSSELAIGLHDGQIVIWNAATRQTIRIINGRPLAVSRLIVLPTGDLSGCSHDQVIIWDTTTGLKKRV